MNQKTNPLTARTIGLYLVVAMLLVGAFTTGLLIMKHSSNAEAVSEAKSEQRDDGRYTLAVSSTATTAEQAAPDPETESESTIATAAGQATGSSTSSVQAAPSTTSVTAAQQGQAANAPPAQAATQQAPTAAQPAQTASAQQPAPAATPQENPSLLGRLLDGILGILALR